MSEERRKILEMLAAGTIDADDAERLLERLSARPQAARASARTERPGGEGGGEGALSPARGAGAAAGFVLVDPERPRRPTRVPLRFLRVVVESAKEETVNIRIPLALVRKGLKLTTMLPPAAEKRLVREGIDLSALSQLQGEELIEALRELKIDVDTPEGDKVRIFCE